MRKIPLRGKYGEGKFTIVDDDVYEWASKEKWHLHKQGNVYYPRNGKGEHLHRIILGAKKGNICDHINRDTLDNRTSNLRITNRFGNRMNVAVRQDSSSGYKGVTFSKRRKKWHARIQSFNKRISLGYFNTAKKAARAYNVASKKYHKEFAYTNYLTD